MPLKTRCPAAMTALGIALAATSGHGQPQACEGPRFEADTALSSEWQQALAALQERLRTARDLDRCARIEVRPSEDAVVIRVSLPDGRVATRRLERPEMLADTVDALVELPPIPGDRAQAGPQREKPALPSRAATGASRRESVAPGVQLELGIGPMGRIAAAPWLAGIGVAGLAQMHFAPWIAGLSLRWESDELTSSEPPEHFEMQTSGVSVFLGRRFQCGPLDVDVLIAPELVVEAQEAGTSGNDIEGSVADVRLDAATRISKGIYRQLRVFAGIDADISPIRLRHERHIDQQLPGLPAWSTGAILGVIWSPT